MALGAALLAASVPQLGAASLAGAEAQLGGSIIHVNNGDRHAARSPRAEAWIGASLPRVPEGEGSETAPG